MGRIDEHRLAAKAAATENGHDFSGYFRYSLRRYLGRKTCKHDGCDATAYVSRYGWTGAKVKRRCRSRLLYWIGV